jgi:hypothetical protein
MKYLSTVAHRKKKKELICLQIQRVPFIVSLSVAAAQDVPAVAGCLCNKAALLRDPMFQQWKLGE